MYELLVNKYKKIRKGLTEPGFTLVEVLVGIAIVGILASIAYPIWTNIQNQEHESAVKQKLSQVAVLIEQESIDNNGLIPKYVPNEVLSDKIAKDFTFEHKDRLDWCVTAKIESNSLFPFSPSTTTLWFVSSENTVPSNTTICGGPGYEPMEGSSAPWETPTLENPQIASHNTTWPNTNNHATFNTTYSAGSCSLNSTDNGLFNPNVNLQYRVELQNMASGRTSTVLSTNLTNLTNTTIASMGGFYPGDPYQVRVQSVCTIQTNNGFPYEYYSDWSTPVTGTTATFVVPSPTWSSFSYDVGTGNSSTSNRFSASWASPYVCPTGSTKRYTIAVTLPGATSLPTQTVATTALSVSNQALTQNRPGFRYAFALRAICDYNASGVNINVPSSPTTRTDRAVLRPPTGSLTVEDYTSPNETITVTPSGFTINRGDANQFACAAGNPVVTMNVRDSSGVDYTPRTVSFGAVADYFNEIITRGSVGKTLTVTGTVACSGVVDGATQTSAASPNTATGTFLIRYKIPSMPDAPSGFGNNASGSASYDNDQLTWTQVSCEFDGTPEYEVRQMQKASNNVFAVASRPAVGGIHTTNYVNLTDTQIGPGATVQFEVRARCTNFAGSSAWTAYTTSTTGASWTTSIPAPGAPEGDVAGGSSNAYTINLPAAANRCPAGTTHQAYVVKDRNNDNALVTPTVVANWVNATANYTTTFSYTSGYWVGGSGRWRCAGPDAVSDAGPYAAGKNWVIPLVYSSTWMTNIGRNPTVNGSCNSGWVSHWRVYGQANFGWYDVWQKSYYNGNYWGRGWYEGSMGCATPYTSHTSTAARVNH